MGNVLNVLRLFSKVAAVVLLFALAFAIFLLPAYVYWQFHTGAWGFEIAVVALLTILCYVSGVSRSTE